MVAGARCKDPIYLEKRKSNIISSKKTDQLGDPFVNDTIQEHNGRMKSSLSADLKGELLWNELQDLQSKEKRIRCAKGR